MATVEMETRLQSHMGGNCRRRTRVQAREKQLSRKLRLGSSQRRNGGQRVATTEDFMNVLTVFKVKVLNRLTSGKYLATPCTDRTDVVSIDNS